MRHDRAYRHALRVAQDAAAAEYDDAVRSGDQSRAEKAEAAVDRLTRKRARVAARQDQVDRRGEILRRHFADAVRLCDAIIAETAIRSGGVAPDRMDGRAIAQSDPETAPWGEWLRDLKRAIDAADDGAAVTAPPLPPIPSWFELSSARAALAAKVGAAKRAG